MEPQVERWPLRWRPSHNCLNSNDRRPVKRSVDWGKAVQALNEYDLSVLPTIPWALVPSLQKSLQCLMIPRTLGRAPTLINEPHLRGVRIPGDAVAKTVVLGNPGSPWRPVPPECFSTVEGLAALGKSDGYTVGFFCCFFFRWRGGLVGRGRCWLILQVLSITTQFKYNNTVVQWRCSFWE